jgi:hypothetical protein
MGIKNLSGLNNATNMNKIDKYYDSVIRSRIYKRLSDLSTNKYAGLIGKNLSGLRNLASKSNPQTERNKEIVRLINLLGTKNANKTTNGNINKTVAASQASNELGKKNGPISRKEAENTLVNAGISKNEAKKILEQVPPGPNGKVDPEKVNTATQMNAAAEPIATQTNVSNTEALLSENQTMNMLKKVYNGNQTKANQVFITVTANANGKYKPSNIQAAINKNPHVINVPGLFSENKALNKLKEIYNGNQDRAQKVLSTIISNANGKYSLSDIHAAAFKVHSVMGKLVNLGPNKYKFNKNYSNKK